MSARLSAAGGWVSRRFHSALRGPDGEKGVIAILAALLLTIMILGTAFAVDITGRVMELRRDQATADLSALDASWGIGTGTYQNLAYTSALRNGVDHTQNGVSVNAQLATYANGTCTVGGASPNAVQVAVTTPYNDFFGATHSQLTRYACATNSGKAQFSIGTTLVDVNAGLDALGLPVGSNLGLVGYQGLASGNVTLGALATQLGFGALSPDQVLAQNVTVGQLLSASSALLNANGNPTAAAQLSTLGVALNSAAHGTTTANLGKILNLQQGTGVALGTGINLLNAVGGGLELANQKAGINLGLTTTSPQLASLGLTSISTNVTAIVPPTMSPYGPVGISATNAQATVAVSLGVCLSVNLLGVCVISATVPMAITLGGATGTLTAIDCVSGSPTDIKVGTVFQAVNVNVNDAGIAVIGAQLLGASGGITVANNPVAGSTITEPTNFNFINPNNTPNPTTPTPVSVSASLGATTSSLTLNVVGLLNATTTINGLMVTDVPAVINAINQTLGSSFGINTDTADYLGNKASCTAPSLVQ